jgi:hypothetical protein
MNLAELLGVQQTQGNWLIPVRIPMPWETTKVTEKVIAREIPERRCAHCGKVFQPMEKRTRCCSVSCGVKHSMAVRAGRVKNYTTPIDIADRRCKICDSVFRPKNGKQIYCGPECYKVGKSALAKEYNLKMKGKKDAA